MPSYCVTWEIDINAETSLLAAKEALKVQRDPSSSATVFSVVDESGEIAWIDLEGGDSQD